MPVKQLKIWIALGGGSKVVFPAPPESRTCRVTTPEASSASRAHLLIKPRGYHVSSGTLAVASALTRLAITRWEPTCRGLGAHLHRSWLSSTFSQPLELGALRRRFVRMACGDVRMYNVVFVLGGPGAGKGTQCQRIEEVISRCTYVFSVRFHFILVSHIYLLVEYDIHLRLLCEIIWYDMVRFALI